MAERCGQYMPEGRIVSKMHEYNQLASNKSRKIVDITIKRLLDTALEREIRVHPLASAVCIERRASRERWHRSARRGFGE